MSRNLSVLTSINLTVTKCGSRRSRLRRGSVRSFKRGLGSGSGRRSRRRCGRGRCRWALRCGSPVGRGFRVRGGGRRRSRRGLLYEPGPGVAVRVSGVLRLRPAADPAVPRGPPRVLIMSSKAHVLSHVSGSARRKHSESRNGKSRVHSHVPLQIFLVR